MRIDVEGGGGNDEAAGARDHVMVLSSRRARAGEGTQEKGSNEWHVVADGLMFVWASKGKTRYAVRSHHRRLLR